MNPSLTLLTPMGRVTLDTPQLDSLHSTELCHLLEEGQILFFPRSPVQLPAADIEFLLNRRQAAGRFRKNIAYKPALNVVSGAVHESAEISKRLLEVMQTFSVSVTSFLTGLLAPYAATWRLDYASFRPQQERGRKMKFHARNDLMHIDAFPTRPTYGNRILRFFININPEEPRHWITAESFDVLLREHGGKGGIPLPAPERWPLARWRRGLAGWAKSLGLPVAAPSRYDLFMLRLHDYLKEKEDFQLSDRRESWEFPPNSAWIVFTDFVSHAALEGQFALEQTFLVDYRSMVEPERSPVRLLEEASGISPLT